MHGPLEMLLQYNVKDDETRQTESVCVCVCVCVCLCLCICVCLCVWIVETQDAASVILDRHKDPLTYQAEFRSSCPVLITTYLAFTIDGTHTLNAF